MPLLTRWALAWVAGLALALATTGCPSDDDDSTTDDDDSAADDDSADDDTGPPMPTSFVVAAVGSDQFAVVDPEQGDEWALVDPGLARIDDVSLWFEGRRALLVGASDPLDDTADVYVCDAMDGSDLAAVATFTDAPGATAVDGSPVEERLAYSAWAVDEGSGELRESIFVSDLLGEEVSQLTVAGEVLALPGSGVTVISNGETMPNWAPVGSSLVYVAHTVRQYPPETEYDVVVVMADDGTSKTVVYASEGDAGFRAPCFTSDSDFVLVSDRDGEGNRRVRTVYVAAGTYSDVTADLDLPEGTSFGDVACANAVTRLAYTLGDDGDGPLYTALLQFTGTALLVNGDTAQMSSDETDHGHRIPDWARHVP